MFRKNHKPAHRKVDGLAADRSASPKKERPSKGESDQRNIFRFFLLFNSAFRIFRVTARSSPALRRGVRGSETLEKELSGCARRSDRQGARGGESRQGQATCRCPTGSTRVRSRRTFDTGLVSVRLLRSHCGLSFLHEVSGAQSRSGSVPAPCYRFGGCLFLDERRHPGRAGLNRMAGKLGQTDIVKNENGRRLRMHRKDFLHRVE